MMRATPLDDPAGGHGNILPAKRAHPTSEDEQTHAVFGVSKVSEASPLLDTSAPGLVTTDASSLEGETDAVESVDVFPEEESTSTNTTSTTAPSEEQLRTPLRFTFKGWSIWLDLQQSPTRDIDAAISYAASRENVHPIPAPHVTVLYGMNHLDEDNIRRRFRELNATIASIGTSIGNGQSGDDTAGNTISKAGGRWPTLLPKGVLVDTEYDGVNGGTMDMSWMEISLSTSDEHERYVDAVYTHFYGSGGSSERCHTAPPVCQRPRPWVPHLSLCYDNPEDSKFDLDGVMDVVARYPSLLGGGQKGDESGDGLIPSGLSLWNTEGQMDQWVCLERIEFSTCS